MVSQLALRVALKTMKERCLSLQQRLFVVEEENEFLRARLEANQKNGLDPNFLSLQNKSSQNEIELESFRSQVSQLNRQNGQLTNDIKIVAKENRRLWLRLSEMSKNKDICMKQEIMEKDDAWNLNTELEGYNCSSLVLTACTLPAVCKWNYLESAEQDKQDDHTLNKILLFDGKDFENAFNTEPNLVDTVGIYEKECEIPYPNVNNDFKMEAEKCLEGLHSIRLEVMEQQFCMASTISALEKRFVLQDCLLCSHTSEMVDKCCSTDDVQEGQSCCLHRHDEDESYEFIDVDYAQALQNKEFMKRKLEADKKIKVCPMCSLVCGVSVTFDSFCRHVEGHFYDDCL